MIVATPALLVVLLATILLAAAEVGGAPQSRNVQWSLGLLFEVVSALSTVGLSTGSSGFGRDFGSAFAKILARTAGAGSVTAPCCLASFIGGAGGSLSARK